MKEKSVDIVQLGEIGLENFAPYLMNRIMGRFNSTLQSEIVAKGITVPKLRTLAILSVRENITISELAVFAVVEHSTMSRTLCSLEEDDLIVRTRDVNDNRTTRVKLTDAGRDMFLDSWPIMATATDQLLTGVTGDERRAFIGTLQKVLANVRKNDFI